MKDNLLYFDFSNFWEESKYAMENYTEEKINADMLKNISSKIKYKLPESYLNLLKNKNGGIPKKTCYPMKEKTSWADNHIAITGLLGVDQEIDYKITFVADTFEDFIRGLRSEKEINNKKGDDSIS